MSIKRMPEALHTLYAELLDQAILGDAETHALGVPPGSFVSKTVGGRTYWYLQRMEAGRKRQHYLGPESPALLRRIEQLREQRAAIRSDEARRGQLVSALLAAGATGVGPAEATVLRLLSEVGFFRLGGVLVGTHAFACFSNMLGVAFPRRALSTQDIGLAQDPAIAVAVAEDHVPADLEEALKEADPRFFAVPALDPKRASTSFKIRGRDLRVDFLTPLRREGGTRPVGLPLFRVAATPLPFLDFLIAKPSQAVILGGRGIVVNVPQPARFAFHKLWIAERRPATEQAKAAKDRRQASALFEVLREDRPGDLEQAWRAVEERGERVTRAVHASLRTLDPAVRDRLSTLLEMEEPSQ